MSALATGDGVTRASVAAEVGLTRATVSTLVDELLAAGLVEERGARRPGTVGRPGTALALADTGPAGVGAEIGVDHLAACVVDLTGAVRCRVEARAANRGRDAADVLAELAGLTAEAGRLAEAENLRPVGTTVAVPGLVGHDRGTVLRAPNLRWEDVPVAAALGRDTVVENEANLGALAELWLGGHPGLRDFVHVSAEIGIGAAVVVEGRLFRGARGFAGELGHVPVRPDGPLCSCGATGCLETYAGEEALLRAAGIGTGDGPGALHAAAAAGDPAALAALEEAGAALGIALSGAVNLLDPQAVVVGGPLADLAPWLLPGVRRELAERVTDRQWRPQDVVTSALGPDGVLRGAAYSAVRAVLDDPASWIASWTAKTDA
ncbi:ROK family transcriptional regulator [Actinacidiphila acididurans]|uniref:ROK family transcriptional regulator n=1 Tax=Actinacidiphila acididurans TaxID=2784346 RepID=A0ABS2TML0_9ACTN|nr:ROK family transcriptional regulator [Actinacidiphila acididurans]MBM9504584.1 ROK family transcriptional regulator [Actinacidiphila acididurans]